MARFIALGFWVITGIAVLFFFFCDAQEFDSIVQDQFDSAEEVGNRQSGPGLQQSGHNNRRRIGGTIKYKKISVMKSGSGFEKPDLFEVSDLGQNKTRKLKTKTSNRHTMIYRPTKKIIHLPKKDSSLELSTASTTQSPEVKVQGLPVKSQNYGTKSWQQVEPVTEMINSFIRPTKRNRLRVNNRPSHDTTSTTTATATPKVTMDPLRPISRVRSGSITTTTSAPTTSKFLRLSRKPNRWQSNLSNGKKHQQPTNEHDGGSIELPFSVGVIGTTESTTVHRPNTDVTQLTRGTVVDVASKDVPQSAEIEHVKDESSIRNIAAKPDKIAYFDMSESISQPKSAFQDSRTRIHTPKKDSASTNYENHREREPILLQTKEQREQQELQKNEDTLHGQPEVSVQFPRVRQRIPPQAETNSQQQFETVEETEKIIEKYESEKEKQLDRLRQSKIPDAIIQFGEESQSSIARIVPSRTRYQNSSVRNSSPVQGNEESVDFTRVPPSDFGQRFPPGQNNLPKFDSRPDYYEFKASYPSPGNKVEQQIFMYNPSVHSGTRSNPNDERHRPETDVYHATSRPNVNQETYRRPELIYLSTTPRPDEEKYLRPQVIYASKPNVNEDRRHEVIYTTVRPNLLEDRRPETVYQTTPRPIVNEEKHRIPDIIYTPPEHEYQPPSAYLTGHGTYPRVRIAYQSVLSTIPPPPVTYEPPHLEYMPPSASPPPRIYVPPFEEFKPPSTAAVIFQGQRPEEKTPHVVHSQRFEDARVIEGIRKLEQINSYTRLVSVGHPSVKQLPYPPERGDGSSRQVQQPEPIVIAVTENPYRSYERIQGANEKGEQFQEKPFLLHGNYQREPAPVGKAHLVESSYVISNGASPANHERPRPTFDASSLIVGKPYPSKDAAPVQIHLATYASYDRPNSESQIIERPAYSSHYGEVNTGRRFPDSPPSLLSERPLYQSHQFNQASQSYQFNQPSPQAYHQPQQSQIPLHIQPLSQSKEPRNLNFPPSATERPYVINLPVRNLDSDSRYEHINVISVSEQPHHKHYGPPEDEIVVEQHTERPQQEIQHTVSERPIIVTVRPHGVPSSDPEQSQIANKSHTERPQKDLQHIGSEKPITVTVRPHGLPSSEPERSEVVYQSHVPNDQSSVLISMSETKTNMAKNQNQQDQQTRPDVPEQRPQHQSELHSNIPASFYPVGPVRAYQVTQAVYASPPPRFFQLPGPLPNPFETQFPSSPTSTPLPPPSLHSSPSRQQPINSFENHLPPGDTWKVNPLFQNQDQFPSNRPFNSSIQPLLPEEPHSSERIVQYRPASFYHDNQRLNRSLTFTSVASHQQLPQLLYDSPIVIEEKYRLKAEDLTYHQPHQQIFNRPPENPFHLQPPLYNSAEESYNHQQQSAEQDFSGVEGTPGVDYPILHSVPTNLKFKCELVESPGTRHPAYYADPYTRCQVFHVCQSNRAKNSFLCPNGTIFNQKVRVCDWWHNVQCDESSAFYSVNAEDENYQFKLSTY